jgi:hypothetical protein
MIFAAMLVEPDAEFELKDLGSIFATLGRLSMNGEMFTPAVHEETTKIFPQRKRMNKNRFHSNLLCMMSIHGCE